MLGTLTSAEIEEVLRDGVVGRIGCLSGGRPYVVPVCYAYRDGYVYGHSVAGAKLSALLDNPVVCFEVEAVDDLSNWRSVIAWGTAEQLGGSDAENGMELLVEHVMPLLRPGSVSAHPAPHRDHPEAAVYRIKLQDSTGRFESTSTDQPSPG